MYVLVGGTHGTCVSSTAGAGPLSALLGAGFVCFSIVRLFRLLRGFILQVIDLLIETDAGWSQTEELLLCLSSLLLSVELLS